MRIIVTTCNRYAHILPAFARAFKRAWPDCPWPITVLWANETGKSPWIFSPLFDSSRFSIAFVRDRGWAGTLLHFLDKSDEPFLLLLDDYILDAVDVPLLETAAAFLEHSPDVGMVRVTPTPGPTLPFPEHAALGEIDKAQPYAISLQAALWKPQVCRDLFRAGEDPWQTELDGSRRASTYTRCRFLGTRTSAIGYRNLMRRGREDPDVRAWMEANL